MHSTIELWQELSGALTRLAGHVARTKTVNINSRQLRERTSEIAQFYFSTVRGPLLQSGLEEMAASLDAPFQHLLELSQAPNSTNSYKKCTKQLKKLSPRVLTALAIGPDERSQSTVGSTDDARIIEILSDLVPSAATSYKQALLDLGDQGRLSFRGPALELREALRETLDHLAPDEDVMAVPGFKFEPERPKPTMKQKVRFILRARGRSKSESLVPETTTNTIEGMVADLTRSIYDKSSVAAHVATSRRNVGQLKLYVGAILHDILEL